METRIQEIKENLFPAAWPAIASWESFPWHEGRDEKPDTHKPHSSQAMALDVFGTLEVHPHRNRLISVMMQLAFPTDGPRSATWSLGKEVEVHTLGEPRPTQLDALIEGEADVVAVESKFCEAGAGTCSQPPRQCNGRYELQTNPTNGVTARCALSGKGIRYWEHIPRLFDLDSEQDYSGECLFRDGKYQYMRNFVAAESLAMLADPPKRSFFVLLYAAGDLFPISQEIGSPSSPWNLWRGRLNDDCRRRTAALSVQDLVGAWARAFPDDAVLADLENWILTKRIPDGESHLA
jgi:hypothetical protein